MKSIQYGDFESWKNKLIGEGVLLNQYLVYNAVSSTNFKSWDIVAFIDFRMLLVS